MVKDGGSGLEGYPLLGPKGSREVECGLYGGVGCIRLVSCILQTCAILPKGWSHLQVKQSRVTTGTALGTGLCFKPVGTRAFIFQSHRRASRTPQLPEQKLIVSSWAPTRMAVVYTMPVGTFVESSEGTVGLLRGCWVGIWSISARSPAVSPIFLLGMIF